MRARAKTDATQAATYIPGQYYNRAKFFERVYADAHGGAHDSGTLGGLQLVGPDGEWTKYSNPAGTVCDWLCDFEDVVANPPPPGNAQQNATRVKLFRAIDLLMGDAGLGG